VIIFQQEFSWIELVKCFYWKGRIAHLWNCVFL